MVQSTSCKFISRNRSGLGASIREMFELPNSLVLRLGKEQFVPALTHRYLGDHLKKQLQEDSGKQVLEIHLSL